MSAESVALAYFERIAARDAEGMAALWEPGSIDRLVGLADLRAPDEISSWFGDLFAAIPDLELEVLETVVEGPRAAVRWRIRGTFDGTARFAGLEPNGSQVDMEGFDLLTVADEKITGNQAYLNGAEMARQLGALPPDGSLPDKAMLGALNLFTRAKGALRR